MKPAAATMGRWSARWMAGIGLSAMCALAGVTAAGAGPAAVGPIVSVRDGRMTVHADGVPLSRVLEALARTLGIEVHIAGDVSADPVSVRLTDVDVDAAVRRVLSGYSHVVVYSAARAGAAARPALARIVVIGTQEHPARPVVSVASDASERWREASPHVPRRTVRRLDGSVPPTEVEQIVEDGLLIALHDTDERVRAAAVQQMASVSDRVPTGLLSDVALRDASPSLRVRALELLAERAPAAARDTLRRSLWDADQDVQARAAELLERLGQRTRSREGASRLQERP